MGGACKVLVRKEKDDLKDLDVDGRMSKWDWRV
jgi:hypothetical protein